MCEFPWGPRCGRRPCLSADCSASSKGDFFLFTIRLVANPVARRFSDGKQCKQVHRLAWRWSRINTSRRGNLVRLATQTGDTPAPFLPRRCRPRIRISQNTWHRNHDRTGPKLIRQATLAPSNQDETWRINCGKNAKSYSEKRNSKWAELQLKFVGKFELCRHETCGFK
jgi:hypothetical protein